MARDEIKFEYVNANADQGPCLGATIDSCTLFGAEELIERHGNFPDAVEDLEALSYEAALDGDACVVKCSNPFCRTVLRASR